MAFRSDAFPKERRLAIPGTRIPEYEGAQGFTRGNPAGATSGIRVHAQRKTVARETGKLHPCVPFKFDDKPFIKAGNMKHSLAGLPEQHQDVAKLERQNNHRQKKGTTWANS